MVVIGALDALIVIAIKSEEGNALVNMLNTSVLPFLFKKGCLC